jgi:hypothetical protein
MLAKWTPWLTGVAAFVGAVAAAFTVLTALRDFHLV